MSTGTMNEEHFKEIEAALLYIGEARERTTRAHKALTKMQAKPHLIDALKRAENELKDTARLLMHGTYYAHGTNTEENAAEQVPLP